MDNNFGRDLDFQGIRLIYDYMVNLIVLNIFYHGRI
jgi:hypothetical protein